MRPPRGFTLIELLVVIAIIGLLSSVVLASLNTARGKARDAARLSDMHQIETALALYLSTHGAYPNSNFSGCGGWETSGADAASGKSFVEALVADGDLPSGVHDPNTATEGTCSNYRYYRYGAGASGCDASRGAFYVIGIAATDKSGTGAYPSSPGWSCPSRNWQGEMSWVTGKFER